MATSLIWGVSCRSRAELEEMPPFPQVGSHHHLRLEAVGQYGPGLLGRAAKVEHVEISIFRLAAGPHPMLHGGAPF